MRSTHTRWAMFSPLLADQVIDISDMPQSTGSNKHIWRISRLIYPKSLLVSCILLSWLNLFDRYFAFNFAENVSRSSDEDVCSLSYNYRCFKKGFLSERARCTRVIFPIKSPKKKLLITICALRV